MSKSSVQFKPQDTAVPAEKTVLVGVDLPRVAWPVESSLDELGRLVQTAGGEVVGRFVQRLDVPVPKTLIGSGKVAQIAEYVAVEGVDTVVFDDELTPSQQSNLESAFGSGVKVLDRTALILDIFGMHARTKEGRLQVQLAQLQYLLPRLRGMWAHLAKEQTRGGIGSRFGQGESQLEVDRRLVRNRISQLRGDLASLEGRREVQSKLRRDSDLFRVALAGYTNAGKSSLLNGLTGADVLAQDKLFATLDPTTRVLELEGGREVTLTDTVGFIQKLPHQLVEAFESTLSEVRGCDLVLEVVDASDPQRDRHRASVARVLEQIGADSRPRVTVFNKSDLLVPDERHALRRRFPGCEVVSAATGEGVPHLLARIGREAAAADVELEALLPYGQSGLASLAHRQGHVLDEEFGPDGVRMTCRVPRRLAALLAPYRVGRATEALAGADAALCGNGDGEFDGEGAKAPSEPSEHAAEPEGLMPPVASVSAVAD